MRDSNGLSRVVSRQVRWRGTRPSSLANAVRDETHREATMFTFVVTLSGVSVAKIGSPFWGALAGVIAMVIVAAGAFERFRGVEAPRS